MTYLVGLRYKSVSAILCDSVISTNHEIVSDTFLKSGSIAPGIIYAFCGDVDAAQSFIIEAKVFLTGLPINDNFWKKFTSFASHYLIGTSIRHAFTLLLSERSTGQPRFHVFDSKKGFIENVSPPITLGSGKELLDQFIQESWDSEIHEQMIRQNSLLPEHFPYLYSLFLMEYVQGLEAPKLRNKGVGGYFHFSYQTNNTESRQSPAVYILADINPADQITGYVYRVSFCGPALVIECPIKNQRIIQLESSSWPKCGYLTKDAMEELHKKIDEETLSQPFYNVCGFGVANTAIRGTHCMDFKSSDDYLIDRQRNFTKKGEEILRNIISGGMNLNHCE